MKPERAIQRAGIQALKMRGCECIKMGNASRRGVPDVLVLFPWGGYCFIEFKTEDGKLMPIQREMFTRLDTKVKSPIHICRSRDETVAVFEAYVTARDNFKKKLEETEAALET